MKYRMKKLISMLMVICLTVSLLPAAANAAGGDSYAVPANVVLYELEGSSGNKKSESEYLWINGTTLYVVFCVRGDKPFTKGTITVGGKKENLSFDSTLYRKLQISGNELKPKEKSDGEYYWQIASCKVPAQNDGGNVVLSASGGAGGFAISNASYTLAVKYGMDVTKTLIEVNGGPVRYPVEVGDKLIWEIKVKNTGDFSLSNIAVEDTIGYSDGESMDGTAVLSGERSVALAAGKETVLQSVYVVREEDAGKTVVNTVTARDTSSGLEATDSSSVYVSLPPVTVTWVNYDGTVLEVDENVPQGTMPSYNGTATPDKPDTDEKVYTFAGWEPAVSPVTDDETYTAVYTETTRRYTVTWADYNGDVLKTETVEYGTVPSFDVVPERAPNSQYTYTFAGWDPAVSAVTDDVTYTATYTTQRKTYSAALKVRLDGRNADIDSVHPGASNLCISADGGSTVYLMEKKGTGLYVATDVPHGSYQVYEVGSSAPVCSQIIVVKDAGAEVFCDNYSVIYRGKNADSGVPEKMICHLNDPVDVVDIVPVRSGYMFKGWLCDDRIYQPGEMLTRGITKSYTLTAQWVEAVDVYVNVHLDHVPEYGGRDINDEKDDVALELVWRPNDESMPWLEVPGTVKRINKEDHDGFDYYEFDPPAVIGTDYIANTSTFSGVEGGDRKFSVTFDKISYDLDGSKGTAGSGITAVEDEDGNWTIDLYLKYSTTNFELEFSAEMDSSVPPTLYPDALIARVLYWDGDSWEIISQQDDGKPGVSMPIQSDGTAKGTYSVWQADTSETPEPYGYRFEVSAFVYDGNIVPCNSGDLVSYTDGDSTATMYVNGGQTYGSDEEALEGAYFDGTGQAGRLNAVVTVPYYSVYQVTLDGNGGTFSDASTKVIFSDLLEMPDLADSACEPSLTNRTFLGYDWYEDVDEDGVYDESVDSETSAVTAGRKLDKSYILVARWSVPQTVRGIIEVAGTYTLDGETKVIQDADRIREVTVVLQHAAAGSSVFHDMRAVEVDVAYTGNSGISSYEFTDVPDNDGTWRVHILGRNYTTAYKNEDAADYGPETAESNSPGIARDTKPADDVATVDIRMEFSPRNFDLRYRVDASAIAVAFRPDDAEVLVLYDDETAPGSAPQTWPVISQMQTGGTAPDFIYKGETVTVGQQDSYPVWQYHPNERLYDYAIRLQSVDNLTFTGAEPYTVSYNGSTFYQEVSRMQRQSRELVAKLTPKTYAITYDLGIGGYWPEGTEPENQHIWSKDTPITALPERAGYSFDGWTANVSNAYVDGKITAATAQTVALTAKWIKNEGVSFVGESGVVTYNGTLQSLTGFTVNGLPEGYTYEGLSYRAEGSEVGTYRGSFRGMVQIRDSKGNDVTHGIRCTLIPGTLVIKEAEKPERPERPDRPDSPAAPGTGSVTLKKVDAADRNTVLANVVFDLYRADDTKVGTYTTGTDGTVTVADLSAGEYYWIEIRPAEGYMLDSSRHTFKVSGGETVKVSISNTRTAVPTVFSNDHYGYVIGFSDGLVHPEANITRAQVATIFFRLLDEETRNENMRKSNDFLDVSEDMWCNVAVSTLSDMGIINGYADGNFYPNATITRAQFAAIAARFDAAGNTTGAVFRDIYNHWAQREINVAYNNGWILGYSDGTFRPNQNITRAEAVTLINRVLQRVPETPEDLLEEMVQWPDNMDPAKWYYLAIQEATNSHDYSRKENGYEHWTELKEVRDWAELER